MKIIAALLFLIPGISHAAYDPPSFFTKSYIGLGNVDNTSDANKPISTATQAALNATPHWIHVTKAYTDFAQLALQSNIEVLSLPTKGVIHAAYAFVTTNFSGGIIATYTISIGISGNFTKYLPATNVFSSSGILPGFATTTPAPENYAGVTSIRAQATSTVANLNSASQGVVEIYILYSILP